MMVNRVAKYGDAQNTAVVITLLLLHEGDEQAP